MSAVKECFVRAIFCYASASNQTFLKRQLKYPVFLKLVTDTYQKGAASIITLIDAQNAALSTDLSAANAVYEFLLDLMEVQRATAKFDFFLKPAERKAWYERIDAYFKQRINGIR